MALTLNEHTELNPLQISLLRLFNRPMPDNEVLELKRLLVNHFSGVLDKEVTEVVKTKDYTQKDFDNILNADD